MLEKKYLDRVKREADKILKRSSDIQIVAKYRENDAKYKDAVVSDEAVGLTEGYYITREAYRMAAHARGYTDDVLEERK
jgi:hypothetical protein